MTFNRKCVTMLDVTFETQLMLVRFMGREPKKSDPHYKEKVIRIYQEIKREAQLLNFKYKTEAEDDND